MPPTVNPQLSRRESRSVDDLRADLRTAQSTDVDTALTFLRQSVHDCGWTLEALSAHMQLDKSLISRVLNNERPLTLTFLCALPDDVEACYEAKRAEYFGHVVVEPLEGPTAVKALVAGLVGVLGGLPRAACARVRPPRKTSEEVA